ncbi:MAG: cysteine desulfurase family protein [Thermoanaerobaculum sp.]|nr:cysteine desulfurase family protein [Thermoanaerobaculum sp.]
MRAYLDHNATTFPLPEVWDQVLSLRALRLGNPSSPHQEGRQARLLLDQARWAVARLLDAEPEEVVFTSSGTEANLTALQGLARSLGGPAGIHLYLGSTEHPSVFAAAQRLEAEGARVTLLPVDSRGLVRGESLRQLVAPAVVCVQLANHETGVLQPLPELLAQVRDQGVRVHCDAVQAVGKIPVSFRQLPVHTMSLSGHKIGGLAGGAALLVRSGVMLPPLIPGEQERRLRGGTEAVLACCALGWACRVWQERQGFWGRVESLRDAMEARLLATVPGLRVVGEGAPRTPNTSCLAFPPPLRGDTLVTALDLEGIAVSSGPACSSGALRESAVVRAMGMADLAPRTLRVSLGFDTAAEELDVFVDALLRVIARAGTRP